MTTSMTGFAAHSINLDHASVNIDLRSVNQRYLELHFRLADEFRPLEPQLRELINQRLARGKVECRIGLTPLPLATQDNGLNPAILERLAHWQSEVLQRLPDSAPPERQRDSALARCGAGRGTVAGRAERRCAGGGARHAGRTGGKPPARRRQAASSTFSTGSPPPRRRWPACSPCCPRWSPPSATSWRNACATRWGKRGHERLAQEIALAAQKADIDEELSRLTTHFAEVRRVLNQAGAIGKRLDFLMQELHREANTLGSKSVAVETSRVSLELKVLIEQMREQVQNIE